LGATNLRQDELGAIPAREKVGFVIRKEKDVPHEDSHCGTAIHMAFFKVDEADKVPNMAGYKRR
jgi:hypothetical protein